MRSIDTHQFAAIIENVIMSGLHQPILGLGAPGIGKSEIVQQVAAKHGYRVIDLRLGLFSQPRIRHVRSGYCRIGFLEKVSRKRYCSWTS